MTLIDSLWNSSHALWDQIWNFGVAKFDNMVTGGLGALFGALVAFQIERHKSAQARAAAQRADLLETYMSLICHINSLEDLRSCYAPFRDLPNREGCIPEMVHVFDDVAVDVRKISFILDGSDPRLVMDIYNAEMGYRSACNVIRLRNEKHRELLAGATIHTFNDETGRTQMTADLPTLKLLRDATEGMYQFIDQALAGNEAAIRKLRDHALKLYPKKKFALFELDRDSRKNETTEKPKV